MTVPASGRAYAHVARQLATVLPTVTQSCAPRQRHEPIRARAVEIWTLRRSQMKSLRCLSTHIAAWMLLSLAVAAHASPPADNHLVIRTLSTDAASVSGGDVLVRIDIPSNASP